MPTIITRGAASARGYGFSQGAAAAPPGPVLQTVTFTSSGTWVAPAGVTTVTALSGAGSAGTGSYNAAALVDFSSVESTVSGSGPNGLPIPWSAVANTTNITVSRFNASNYNPSYQYNNRSFTFYSNNTFAFSDNYETFPYYVVTGTWSLQSFGSAPNPPSGSAAYGASGSYYAYGLYVAPGFGGDASTAFGYSFPGGGVSGTYPNETGDPASPVSYGSFSVTPGASYPINVAGGGYVTIQYYA